MGGGKKLTFRASCWELLLLEEGGMGRGMGGREEGGRDREMGKEEGIGRMRRKGLPAKRMASSLLILTHNWQFASETCVSTTTTTATA